MICLRDLCNLHENMPESPENKSQASTSSSSSSSNATVVNRPSSTTTPSTGMNGTHSPHSSVNGGPPTSPTNMATPTNLSTSQLPPACGARQLSKLKRFLTTLQQFGADISPEIGERVRSLVLGLVNSTLSIEDFHSKLQEATNFPLRPFVIPFLKANLPLLQRELIHCARLAKQTPQQYLSHNEHILLDTSHSPSESSDLINSEINENGKRRSPDSRSKENGVEPGVEMLHPAKRHQALSPALSRMSPGAGMSLHPGGQMRLDDINWNQEMRERERYEREREIRHHYGMPPQHHEPLDDRLLEDEWKHIDAMLNCIIGMVEKAKRAMAMLQHRCLADREELALWARRYNSGSEHDMKKRAGEMMAHTIRQTEDRVSEVKRRAEDAVNEVKRQAVAELQKAVAAAEQKATELVNAERAKMERLLADARRQAADDALAMCNQQDDTSEVISTSKIASKSADRASCWNCGRKANETCSGCNVARYCGSFCQHKDWENHHRICGQNPQSNANEPSTSTATAAVTTATSPSNSTATTSRSTSRSGTPNESKSTPETTC